MPYSIIVGLGNPGREYQDTRHNVGFMVLDQFAESHGAIWKKSSDFKAEITKIEVDGELIRLVKPQKYMNLSGLVLNKFFGYYKIPPSHCVVVYDDVTLNAGASKISMGGGSGGHNGVQDIISKSANTFARYRIGIGPKTHKEMLLSDYVLGKFSADEKSVLTSNMDFYIKGLTFLIKNGVEKAMAKFNQKDKINEHNDIK